MGDSVGTEDGGRYLSRFFFFLKTNTHSFQKHFKIIVTSRTLLQMNIARRIQTCQKKCGLNNRVGFLNHILRPCQWLSTDHDGICPFT